MSLAEEIRRSPAQISSIIDQTNVDPVSTREDIRALCEDVRSYTFYSAVVVPYHVPLASEVLAGEAKVGTVIGFPYGVQSTEAKIAEARAVLEDVDEVDMVMNRTAFRNGDFDLVVDDISRLKDAIGDVVLKCIIESPALTEDEITEAARLVERAGADFVKTAVGYDGPTEVAEIRHIREAVGDDMDIKASGGVSTFEDALAMVEAGATRIGTSSGVEIMQSIPD